MPSLKKVKEAYLEYLWELAEEEYGEQTEFAHTLNKDNKTNLYFWFNCYDDFSWIMYND
jgi:hypothetical protein